MPVQIVMLERPCRGERVFSYAYPALPHPNPRKGGAAWGPRLRWANQFRPSGSQKQIAMYRLSPVVLHP
jgi:hypothetical protein